MNMTDLQRIRLAATELADDMEQDLLDAPDADKAARLAQLRHSIARAAAQEHAIARQQAERADAAAMFRNHYDCPCGESWSDDWSARCDDDCPACGTTCSPSHSEDL